MALLNDFLNSFQLNATIFHRSLVCDAWSTDTSGTGLASFHLVTSGTAYLHSDNYLGEPLNQGDIVIFPHDAPHIISYSDNLELTKNANNFVAYSIEQSLPQSTGLVCGYFDFGLDKQHPIIKQLPNCILVKYQEQQGALKGLIQGLMDEALLGADASDAILGRMSELFFLALLRHLAKQNDSQLGYFRALNDPKMAKVMMAIEQDIGKQWSLMSLAELGGFSRASFAQHFKRYMNSTPLEYLTRIRLSHAQKQLEAGKSVIQVALEVGYQDDAAFAKAYKRQFGFGPGASRAQANT